MKPLLTIRELSQYFKVSERTIYRLLNNNKLKGIKIGGSWRFDEREVKQYDNRCNISCNQENEGEDRI